MKFLIVLSLAAIVYSANGAALQKRDLKSDLLDRATTLETQATAEIKKLTDAGRSSEATRLQNEEKRLQQLATELKDATAETAIRRLETELRAIEMRIAEELRRLERGGNRTTAAPLVKRDLKSDLLDKATALETQVTAEIKKLTDAGRSSQATHLQNEEKRLQQLATELKDATAETAIRRLETELRAIESRITEELRRLDRGGDRTTAAPLVKRDLKTDLLDKATALETQATAEIKKLTDAGRSSQATRLQNEEKRLQQLATELKDATAETAIRRLETELRAIENRIAEELRRLEREGDRTTAAPLVKRDLKTDLLDKATALETQVTAAIKKLTDAGRSSQATHLQNEEKRLQQLATELKAATAETAIRRLETELRGIENRITEELRRLERGGDRTTAAPLVKRDLKTDLLDKAAALETQVTAEIKKLTDAGKSSEATRLQNEEKRLQQLATELKAATAEANIRTLEVHLRAIETRVTEELKRLENGGTKTTVAPLVKRDERDTLLAKATALEKKANDEIKKLTADGKKEDAATLEKEEKALQKLAEELKAATDAAEIKRLDTEVKAAEKRLNDELKRLVGTKGTTAAYF